MKSAVVFAVSISLALSGCQTTQLNKYTPGQDAACKAAQVMPATATDEQKREVLAQIAAVKMTPEDCIAKIKSESGFGGLDGETIKEAAIVIGVLGLVVLVALAGARSGGGNSYVPTDTNWAWDYQSGPNYVPVWVCRGIQTGQYAEPYRCQGKLQFDGTWPGLGR